MQAKICGKNCVICFEMYSEIRFVGLMHFEGWQEIDDKIKC